MTFSHAFYSSSPAKLRAFKKRKKKVQNEGIIFCPKGPVGQKQKFGVQACWLNSGSYRCRLTCMRRNKSLCWRRGSLVGQKKKKKKLAPNHWPKFVKRHTNTPSYQEEKNVFWTRNNFSGPWLFSSFILFFLSKGLENTGEAFECGWNQITLFFENKGRVNEWQNRLVRV